MTGIAKTASTPAKAKKLMREYDAQNFYQDKPMSKKEFLREAYCKMLEEHLDKLGKREHWGETLEWKMRKFSSEARETLELWATIYSKELDFLDGIDEDGEVCSFLKLIEGESIMLNGKEYDNSLYSQFIKFLEKC